MGSHSVIYHLAAMTFLPLPQLKLVLDFVTLEGCKAELSWVVVISPENRLTKCRAKIFVPPPTIGPQELGDPGSQFTTSTQPLVRTKCTPGTLPAWTSIYRNCERVQQHTAHWTLTTDQQ